MESKAIWVDGQVSEVMTVMGMDRWEDGMIREGYMEYINDDDNDADMMMIGGMYSMEATIVKYVWVIQ
jgi:hypothetical protein